MRKYFNMLKTVALFNGIEEQELAGMLTCLKAKIIDSEKDAFILMAGDQVENVGILLNGSAHITKESYEGERTIITTLTVGDFFAEALCCAGIEKSPVNVVATSASTIMLLSFHHILHVCSNSCSFHTKLIKNMLQIIAQKNIMLQNKMDIIEQKTLRLKILSYLKSMKTNGGDTIIIPLNREELADFLCADRTALSHELSRMKKEGLIEFNKNRFKLLK